MNIRKKIWPHLLLGCNSERCTERIFAHFFFPSKLKWWGEGIWLLPASCGIAHTFSNSIATLCNVFGCWIVFHPFWPTFSFCVPPGDCYVLGNLKSNHMKTACTCRMTVKKSSGMQCQQFLDENFETVFNNIFMRCEACPRVEGSHFLQSVLLFHTNC